jgi:hypothetical protein
MKGVAHLVISSRALMRRIGKGRMSMTGVWEGGLGHIAAVDIQPPSSGISFYYLIPSLTLYILHMNIIRGVVML